LKLPAHVLYRKDLSLMLWRPLGTLDEALVNGSSRLSKLQKRSQTFNRFIDLSKLDMVDLNFRFVFHVALHRRLIFAKRSPSNPPSLSPARRLPITRNCTPC